MSSILEAYKNLAMPDEVTITPATNIDFQKLKLYVEDVIGITFARNGLLERWITLPMDTALVAVKENGDVVGFAAVRKSLTLDKTGYRLAPLLADSGDIVRNLLLDLATRVHPEQKFEIFLTSGINDAAKSIRSEVKGMKYMDLVRMYTKGEPSIKKVKYFGTFSPAIAG